MSYEASRTCQVAMPHGCRRAFDPEELDDVFTFPEPDDETVEDEEEDEMRLQPRNKKAPHLRRGHKSLNQYLADVLERKLAAPPTKVTSLKDMSPEKQAEMQRLYGRGT